MYRRKALDDIAIDGQYFDEDFFAYREDADLAWRCRLFGWTSIYVPRAVAQHRRRVTPERRGELPKEINYHSVKNRFLLRLNNMTGRLYRRDFWPITKRDMAVIGYVFLREWSSVPALVLYRAASAEASSKAGDSEAYTRHTSSERVVSFAIGAHSGRAQKNPLRLTAGDFRC